MNRWQLPLFLRKSVKTDTGLDAGWYVAAGHPSPAMAEMTLSKDCIVVNQRSVMVVDGLAETEEVLKAVLEPRGLQVTRVRSTRGSEASTSPEPPSVIVLHETDARRADRTSPAPWSNVPRVVIGQICSHPPSTEQGCRYLSQPFQYAELVTAIESLLR